MVIIIVRKSTRLVIIKGTGVEVYFMATLETNPAGFPEFVCGKETVFTAAVRCRYFVSGERFSDTNTDKCVIAKSSYRVTTTFAMK